jgi:uncharacterized RDD family membrane protein YckC
MQDNEEFEYVGFWARVLATFIDTILVLIISLPLVTAVYGKAYWTSEKSIEGPFDFFVNYIFPLIAVILFWIFKQATPGKMAISAKIVDAKTGKAPSTAQCIGRYFAYFLSSFILGLGFIWVAFDSKKQGWHDKLAGTIVVRVKKKDA